MASRRDEPFFSLVQYSKKFLYKKFSESLEKEGDCVVWTGPYKTNAKGVKTPVVSFGPFNSGYAKPVSQVVWVLHNERSIPAEHVIMRTCDNPMCVKRAHLWAVPNKYRTVFSTLVKKGLVQEEMSTRNSIADNIERFYRRYREDGVL